MDKKIYLRLFEQSQKSDLSERTISHKMWMVESFLDYLVNSHNFEDIAQLELITVVEYINQLPYASQTKSGIEFTLREFLNLLFKHELISFDGYKVFPRIKTNRRSELLSYYSPEEIKTLIESMPINTRAGLRNKCMVMIAAECGLRASDVVWLKLNEIDWANQTICKEQIKTKVPVSIPFSDKVKYLLLDYLKNYRSKAQYEYVFLTSGKIQRPLKTACTLTNVVMESIERAELEVKGRKKGTHTLRHSLATTMLIDNSPLPVISNTLGHINSRTTQVYLSVDIDRLREVGLEAPL